jgi:GAF domain-containing protein
VHGELSAIVLGEQPLGSILGTLADLARRAIPGAGAVSVTLIEPSGKAHSVAFAGDLAVELDERQYEKGYGPCMDAAQAGQTIAIEDTTASEAYPEFATQCLRLGVTNTLSVGMPVPQRSLGAINVYGFEAKPFDSETIEFVQSLAGYAAVAMANASLYDRTAALAKQMEQAMESRAVIEQAKGIIMARDFCTPDEAFEALQKLSQEQNRKLRNVPTTSSQSMPRPLIADAPEKDDGARTAH